MVLRIAAFFGLLAIYPYVGCKDDGKYDNVSLIHLQPLSDEHLQAIQTFEDPEDKIEVLKRSRFVNDTFDVLVPQERRAFIEDFANYNNLGLSVKHKHYGRLLESPEDRTPRRRMNKGFQLFGYNSYGAISEYMDTLAQKNPDLITVENLGNSFQGRRMNLYKVSANPNAGNPIIFIDAGIHAREWVAPASLVYLITRLVTDSESRRHDLKGVDWYFIPVVNPDGYEFTRSSKDNRLWRKTRSSTNINNCYGVDGNRNYGYKWGVSGISNNPCDKETYAGPLPFSEPETKMVRNVMMGNKDRIKLYVTLHAYGQYLVYPWGYTGDLLPKQWRKLDHMARVVSDAVENAGGNPFNVMSAGKWYPAAGGSDDYAFGAVGIPYAYTMELTKDHDFRYPEYLLRKTLPTFYYGFKAFGDEIRNEFSKKKKIRRSLEETNPADAA